MKCLITVPLYIFVVKRFCILCVLSIFVIAHSDAFAFSSNYPKKIPLGYLKEIKGKYRIIEHNNNKHFIIYDANKIEKLGDGIKIYPLTYVQEYFFGVWYEETYNEVFRTIYIPKNIAIIENPQSPKDINYPKSRQPIKANLRETNPAKQFRAAVLTLDKQRKFFAEVSDTDIKRTGTIKIIVSNQWHYLHKQERLQLAQNAWKLWAQIYSPNDVDKARLSLVDYNGNEVGGSRVWGGSLIWVKD